jgi:Tfp pilus assembly protein PilX
MSSFEHPHSWECKCQWEATQGLSWGPYLSRVDELCPVHGREARPGAWELSDRRTELEGERKLSGEGGFVALVLVLVVMAVLTAGTLATTRLSLGATSAVRVEQSQWADEAAAEGAVAVAEDQINSSPTSTSLPPVRAAIDGSRVAEAHASYDVASELWTITGTAGAASVTVTARLVDGRLKQQSWSTP